MLVQKLFELTKAACPHHSMGMLKWSSISPVGPSVREIVHQKWNFLKTLLKLEELEN